MKKVLIISHRFYHPRHIASVRINGLVKFLPKFGWEPYVLTPRSYPIPSSMGQINVFEAPCQDACTKWKNMLGLDEDLTLREGLNIATPKNGKNFIDLFIKFCIDIFTYPDTLSHWRKQAVKLGDEIIRNEKIDVMISSFGPPTCHLIAKDLKKKNDIKWIADFRDLWTQNPYIQYSRFRSFFERRLEIKTLYYADALVTVSQPLSFRLKELHPRKRIFSIPNGFDPAQTNPGVTLAKKFTISYTGVLYQGRRDPEPILKALRNLISNGSLDPNDISVEFYGPKESWLEDDVNRYELNEVVKINGSISREASIEIQRRSHLLLLLTWNSLEEYGVYTGKVFDYLAAKRPIISIGASGGVVEDLLRRTQAGFQPSSQEDIERIIKNAYQEYKIQNTVSYSGEVCEINKFSHKEMSRKFSAILDSLYETNN